MSSTIPTKVSIESSLRDVLEPWRPKVVASLNGQEVKVVRLRGEFTWHHHEDADELFLCLKGRLRIRFRAGDVDLDPGEMLVVPRGVEHCPVADDDVEALLFEPAGVRNTGNVEHPTLTAPPR